MGQALLLSFLLFGAALATQKEKCGRPAVQPMLEPEDRVFGGQVAIPHSWPWMAGLYDSNGNDFCGGALISDRHVLTAAHCFCPERDTKFTVHLGSHKRTTRDRSESVHMVKEVCVHPQYPCDRMEGGLPRLNDIAIITLQDRVNFSEAISPVCLPSDREALPMGSTYHVTGWGRTTSTTRKEKPTELKQGLIQEVPCSKSIVNRDRFICVLGVTGIHRRGDSGGPVVHGKNGTWTVFGLVHSGVWFLNNVRHASATETRVSHYVSDFIQPYLNRNSSKLNICGI
ncbi:chymotrypsinogen B-like [Haemaphysalis longicornis]